ncbi:acyltransferase [Spirosoma taeanense]|uniref:Acyltransferase n=1 Tax=Spirosoma taeanense TaxID=2735870 RepID=A0A6M5Y4Y4_9BACT|nr:acyltransferase [Spirosoma taeanense]
MPILTVNTSITPDINRSDKLALIQLFRGLAALIVLLYHTSTLYATNLNHSVLNNSFKFGKAGVDFFFVLSGFIIYTIHQHDLGVKDRVYYFISKRLIRIFPLYWLMLIPKLLIKTYSALTILGALFLLPHPQSPVLNVSWTLSYELFFYACFSLLIFNKSSSLKYLLLSYGGFIFLYWTSGLLLGDVPKLLHSSHSFIISYHHTEFLFGLAAAYLFSHSLLTQFRYWLLASGLVLFVTASLYTVINVNQIALEQGVDLITRSEDLKTVTENYSYLFFGIPSFLIILGSAHIDKLDKWNVPTGLLFIGNASYAIYLTHSSLINAETLLLKSIWPHNLAITVLPIMLVALLFGMLVHRYIETPILNKLNHTIKRFKVARPTL